MDLTNKFAPRSDQLNADDLIGGPVVVTIESVTEGTTEQPVNVNLIEYPGRPFKPCKTMGRVLMEIWGTDATVYAGRKLRLYRDPDVKVKGEKVGGIRISHMSHIAEKTSTSPLTVTRGQKKAWTVQPLEDAPAESPTAADWAERIAATTDVTELRQMWQIATPEFRQQIQARVKQLEAEAN